jgi:cytochrome b pre-mRNA-processing protein 3
MLLGLLGRKRSPVPGRLHEAIVAAARRPALYARLGAPDTVDGRFELLCLHLQLFLRRARGDARLADLAQEVVDQAFAALEADLRQAGVGDLSVPKKMKRLAGLFYARLAHYDPLVDAGDRAGLEAALRAVVYAGAAGEGPGALGAYVLAADAALRETPTERFLAGELPLPEIVVEARP